MKGDNTMQLEKNGAARMGKIKTALRLLEEVRDEYREMCNSRERYKALLGYGCGPIASLTDAIRDLSFIAHYGDAHCLGDAPFITWDEVVLWNIERLMQVSFRDEQKTVNSGD
jgi:hypothetical protein